MTFTFDASITEPTVLFRSSEYYYPNGYNLLVFDGQGIPLQADQLSVSPRANFVNDIEVKILDVGLHGQDLQLAILQP